MITRTDDLNDDLGNLFGGAPIDRPAAPSIAATLRQQREEDGVIAPAERGRDFTEPCGKCRGTGRFVGYTGRVFGPCFACKGAGKHTFKTSPEQRAKARATSQVRKARVALDKAEALIAAVAQFTEQHPVEVKWLRDTVEVQRERAIAGREPWRFPEELLTKLLQWGTLTEGQLGAVRKCIAKDAERKAAAEATKAAAPTVDASRIERAFRNVRDEAARDREGVKWLKLYLGDFTFLDMPARGQWPAAIRVSQGDRKLGVIKGGKFERFFACDDVTQAAIVDVVADPSAAARAHGIRTGTCSCCGAELTNPASRAAGIGPICAEKWVL